MSDDSPQRPAPENETPASPKGFLRRLFPSTLELRTPGSLSLRQWISFAAIMAVAIAARFLLINRIPPGLWYDEALYSLDGYSVSQGNIAIFFDRFGHPREPFFPWMLGLAFALFEPATLVARCVSATFGSLAAALFFPVARRFLPDRWALAATAAFAVFRWHIHFSRTIFRAGLASPMMLLAVWLFLRWRERKRPLDAALCGIAVAACLYTYISLRIVPILLGFWILWFSAKSLLSLRREWKQVTLLFATALITFLPLGIDYLRNPDHLFGRTDEISMFEKTAKMKQPDGETKEVRVPKSFSESIAGIAANAWGVAKVWFIKGDYVARHGVPYRPVFDPVTGLLFTLGLGICGWALIRTGSATALMLLTWFGGFAMASVFSFGAPNILRMQGASPVVIMIMVLGLHRLIQAWPREKLTAVRRALPACVLIFFAALQLNDYFRVFPNDLRVRSAFGADFFYAPAKAVDEIAPVVDKVYVPAEFMDALQVQFLTIRRKNIVAYQPDQHLPAPAAGESIAWLNTMRSLSLAEEASNRDQLTTLQGLPRAVKLADFTIPQQVEMGGVMGIANQPWAELWLRRPAP